MSDSSFTETEAPVRRGYIMICEKCGTKLVGQEPGAENPSRAVQKKIKIDAATKLGRGEIRPVVSSCLDVCPEGKIAACIVPMNPSSGAPTFLESELKSVDSMANELLEEAIRRTK